MKLKVILVVLFGTLFVGCKKEKTLSEYMVNSWETSYLKIEMPTVNKTDSLSVFEDKFDNNPERLAQSKYNKDGTFSAWFINPKENNIQKQGESKGKWSVEKDSLFIEYFYGGRDVKVAYHISKTEEGFLGKSKYDWDNDGEFDDVLIMKTKKITTK
ncbi:MULTISPECIES: hypothetical protein [Tenacibaculum]|uniref:hypothetical protein n=1 Tax=Tenacibaculum TaxID=104267 RepID=UPI001F0B5CB9|nr:MULTISPECIES: hypothetical protein [Tenacibaculum]MCH3881538.1 hypothetical protein [Tenacibaculum aquimarinum]MDO6598867.1 hypothetical protein [Tenacibaculum sp. 1_MG-2023]